MTNADLKFHPYSRIFTVLEGPEQEALEESIRLHGVGEPIVEYQDTILDGRNRYRAARALVMNRHPSATSLRSRSKRGRMT
jgi:hypothetical protein